MTTNYYTFKFGDCERQLPEAYEWKHEGKIKNEIIISNFRGALSDRMEHCSNNLLTNQSGVVYNDGIHVLFKDGSRFSRPAYVAMESATEKLNHFDSLIEYLRELETSELIQLTKAVGAYDRFTTKEILMDILMEYWAVNFKFDSNEKWIKSNLRSTV